jgi:hypothetical protein
MCLKKFYKSSDEQQKQEDDLGKNWFNLVREKLIEANIISKLTFEFNQKTRQAIQDHKKIIVVQSQNLRCLNNLSFDGFELLKSKRKELLDLIKVKPSINKEDIMKIYATDLDKIKEAEGCFDILKIYLEKKGFAKNTMQAIGIKQDGFNNDEIFALCNVINQLFDLGHPFNIESIKIEPFENLIELLKNQKVIKDTTFKISYNTTKSELEDLKKQLKNLAKNKINDQIDKKIANNTFINEEEINMEANHLKKKANNILKAGLSITTLGIFNLMGDKIHEIHKALMKKDVNILMVVLYGEKWRDVVKYKLIQEKKKKLLKKHPEQVSIALANTVGALKLNAESMICINNIDDYFKGGHTIPPEVISYVDICRDLVIAFVEYESPWNWKTFLITALGIIQVS